MAAKPKISYSISHLNDDGTRTTRPVKGEPISLPVIGNYAIRSDDDTDLFIVDNLDTGMLVSRAYDREEAISLAYDLIREHGDDGFHRAINRWKERLAEEITVSAMPDSVEPSRRRID